MDLNGFVPNDLCSCYVDFEILIVAIGTMCLGSRRTEIKRSMRVARKSKGGLADDLFHVAAMLPWWVGVVLAIVAYAVLHRYATAPAVPPAPPVPGQMAPTVIGLMVRSLATWGQYLVPLLLLAGAAASAIGKYKRQGLIADVKGDTAGAALRAMSWRDFELLVGEAFRMRGYTVAETGGGGADGGIDLTLKRGGETSLVQCKQWRAYKVPVNVVRELYGVMAAQGAAAGFVVTSGVFTAEAKAFAQGRNIELIDGAALHKMIDAMRPIAPSGEAASRVTPKAADASPACPRCGAAMVHRVARQGANAGGAFWGCSAYPKCRGVRAVD